MEISSINCVIPQVSLTTILTTWGLCPSTTAVLDSESENIFLGVSVWGNPGSLAETGQTHISLEPRTIHLSQVHLCWCYCDKIEKQHKAASNKKLSLQF